jgi:hypothetical protein
MFLVRVFEKEEEGLFIFLFQWQCKKRPLSPTISISDVLLKEETLLFDGSEGLVYTKLALNAY